MKLQTCNFKFQVSEIFGLLAGFHQRGVVVEIQNDDSGKFTVSKSTKLSSFNISKQIEIQEFQQRDDNDDISTPLKIPYFGEIKLCEDWKNIFEDNEQELKKIGAKLEKETEPIFPPPDLVFSIFTLPLKDIRVLLIGQDPYHNANQAMGMSFSVPPGIRPPPSLINIFKELENDGFKVKNKNNGDLTKWFKQGVFLLNNSLTVRKGEPNSHEELWRNFTRNILQYLDSNCDELVIIAMGNFAQKVTSKFAQKHRQIKIAHPSPFSCHNFFGTKPFSETNRFLREMKKPEIDWNL
jgi:uracil-DNA glycosylase